MIGRIFRAADMGVPGAHHGARCFDTAFSLHSGIFAASSLRSSATNKSSASRPVDKRGAGCGRQSPCLKARAGNAGPRPAVGPHTSRRGCCGEGRGRFCRSQSQRDSRAVSATVMRMKRRSPISPAPALTFARPFEWRAESLLAVTRGRDTGSGDGLRPAREMDPRGRVGAAVRRAIDDQAVWDHDEDMRATRSQRLCGIPDKCALRGRGDVTRLLVIRAAMTRSGLVRRAPSATLMARGCPLVSGQCFGQCPGDRRATGCML